MNDFIRELSSKERNFFNDINQIVKKSFQYYFIFSNGLITAFHDEQLNRVGIHFSHIDDNDTFRGIINIPESEVLRINSMDMFNQFKTDKKSITAISSEDSVLYVRRESKKDAIGKFITINADIITQYKICMDISNSIDTGFNISDEKIQLMLNNEVVTFKLEDMKIRLTKSLIPHLKVGLPTKISFSDRKLNNLFDVDITLTKNSITSFHRYTCIKF